MTSLDLIGAVAAGRLRRDLDSIRATAGEVSSVARYTLHKLTGAQVAAICRTVSSDPMLGPNVTIRIPRDLVAGEDVPEDAVTDENAAFSRNAPCSTPILLIATTVDDLGDTLKLLTLIGAPELKAEIDMWAASARRGLALPESQEAVWATALLGLRDAEDVSLADFAEYISTTRERIHNGTPLVDALGWALAVLQVPRQSGLFLGINQRDQTKSDKWRKLYQQVLTQRRPLLRKQSGNRGEIDSETLQAQFDRVRENIVPHVHSVVEAFIAAPAGWNEASARLAECEWESEGILYLFEDARPERKNLGTETRDFFEYNAPDRLVDGDKEYLEGLVKRRSFTEPREDDIDFYERHRTLLDDQRALKAKWTRFIYGKPIEHEDFQIGLLLTIERLLDQIGTLDGKRTLTIRTIKRTPKDWFDINEHILRSFALRYRGLKELTRSYITWDTSSLFEPDELYKRFEGKEQPTRSVARAATQIKFIVELSVGEEPPEKRQLVWIGRPGAIGAELPDDLDRLIKRPFIRTRIEQRTVSRKGRLQSVALDDIASFEAAFERDAGSLVGAPDPGADLEKPWLDALDDAVRSGRITASGESTIRGAWSYFSAAFREALIAWRTEGLGAEAVLKQAKAYGILLDTLQQHARGDLNRMQLWEPMLRIGLTEIVGGRTMTIVAPWQPLRLASMAAKTHSLAGLLERLTVADHVTFGDTRLFFSDLVTEFAHPFYPEIAIGYAGGGPVLLAVTETRNDYSLAENPIHEVGSTDTNEDPRDSARQLQALANRYLELQPHEHANLGVALYNCDSTALPLATVAALSSFRDEDEVRCNVVLRHHDMRKMARLYGQMLDNVDADPDAVVASETSRDFMAKLRIGIMLDPQEASASPNGKHIDIAFLQDVVSRRAHVEWIDVPESEPVDLLEHVPARWAYKRSAVEDQLKSTSYLTCPRQPGPGWAYLAAVYGVVEHDDPPLDRHLLPARQIVFQDAGIHQLFREVHNLADWVVNYDDLLDRRQLQNQGISVIRYQRQRNHGRNLIVSTTSPLRTLRVLVKRRLEELDLGMTDERIAALAERMIDDASRVSGDIVLRAAKQGVFAGELVGIVLSRAIAAEELGNVASTAWFFLDDYASWLGHREGRIADLLALSVQKVEGRTVLRALITEAKYIQAESLSDERKSSAQQLEDTVARMHNALFSDPGRLDRDLWLSRLSDLMLDSIDTVATEAQMFEALRTKVRAGEVEIELKGYSHVFVSSASDGLSGAQYPITRVEGCLQEVFSRDQVRALVKAYESKMSLRPIRGALGDERPWETLTFHKPAAPVVWVNRPDSANKVPDRAAASDQDAQPHAKEIPADLTLPESGAPAQEAPTAVQGRTSPSELTAPDPVPQRAGSDVYSDGLRRLLGRISSAERTSTEDDEWLISVKGRLRTALLGYQLGATVLGARLTPNAALIRLQGSDRLNLDMIERRRSELLTTHGLSVINLSARPGEIVVAIARPQREVISLWEVLRRRKVNKSEDGMNTSFVIGIRELDGEVLYLNLAERFAGLQQHAPHTLIAGATGSGKSVLLQNLLLDICATNAPDLAQIIMIDPKMGVDYPTIRHLPHVRGGIITDQKESEDVLGELLGEMDRRYREFAKQGVRNLMRFNEAVEPMERLPAIFLVHDEFAEWMMDDMYKDAVSNTVARLGVKARAAGIHLIFAAQRPDNSVFPMQLRSNLGNRLVLRVEDVGTSEIALQAKGAERLLGNGHLIARLSGEPDLIYAQVPFLSDDDFADASAALMEGHDA